MGVPESLRARIRELEGGVAIVRRRFPTGVPALDGLLGGFPRPGIVEITGPEGSGRVRIAALAAAELTRRGSAVAWIDPARRVFPPGLAGLGVHLPNLLVVRPPEDGTAPWAWATEQVARSGCFPLVVLDLPVVRGVRRAFAQGFARAAEHGGCTLVVISIRSTRDLPADVRLATGAPAGGGPGEVFVVRDRSGSGSGRRAAQLPEIPLEAEPFADLRIEDRPAAASLSPPAPSSPAEPAAAGWWLDRTAVLPMPAMPPRARLARGQRRPP